MHNEFLENNYNAGNFFMSGRKIPRTGGMIFTTINDKDKLLQVLAEDPFNINGLADYEIIEFLPTKTSKELSFLMEH